MEKLSLSRERVHLVLLPSFTIRIVAIYTEKFTYHKHFVVVLQALIEKIKKSNPYIGKIQRKMRNEKTFNVHVEGNYHLLVCT